MCIAWPTIPWDLAARSKEWFPSAVAMAVTGR